MENTVENLEKLLMCL